MLEHLRRSDGQSVCPSSDDRAKLGARGRMLGKSKGARRRRPNDPKEIPGRPADYDCECLSLATLQRNSYQKNRRVAMRNGGIRTGSPPGDKERMRP